MYFLNLSDGDKMPTLKKVAKSSPKKPVTRTTVKRTVQVKRPVRRPPVAQKQKAPTVQPLPPPVQAAQQLTPAQMMWNEIKDLPIQMFGLPGQTVAMHTTPTAVEPSRLYLILRSSAALPALEEAIKEKFTVEMVDKYAIVSRVALPALHK
jgi:hypothetical protein